MMKLQQTAVCPVCFDGLPDGCDIDNYEANWKYWHEHSLGLQQHSEEWALWQKKEPIVTHEVKGSDTVIKHWLCRECVYRHDPVSGTFSILDCPICRQKLVIPGRETGSVAHLQEYAIQDVSDNFQFDADMDEDAANDSGNDSGGDRFHDREIINVYVAGFTPTHMIECMLTREVSTQNAARAAGQTIDNLCVLTVFTLNETYEIDMGDRVNWGVQFLNHATEVLQHWNRTEQLRERQVPVHDWSQGTMFDHAVGAGRFILALTRYHADNSIATPLFDFSPAGRYAVQIQEFKDELRQSSAAAYIRASSPQQVTANPHGVHDHDDDDAETFSALDVEHNEIYACASIFFLVVTIPDFFAGEVAHRGIAQLLELHAQFKLVPPAFSKQEYVERALMIVDNIVEDYNRSVFANRAVTFENETERLGLTQDIIAPRPWVIMQIIQMNHLVYDHHGVIFEGESFNRYVAKPQTVEESLFICN